MKNTLSSYGQEFELKLISVLTDNKSFLTQISDILKPEYFNSDASNWVVKVILNYYMKYNQSPSMVVFNTELAKLDDSQEVLKTQIYDFLKKSLAYKNFSDEEYIKEQTVDFCRNQEIKQAILKSVELLKTSDYDSIKSTLDVAMNSGYTRDIGHIYKDDIEHRYTNIIRNTISTGWEPLDDNMQGGLSSGELGIIVAPAGAGKSWVLSALGANALKKGKTVIHYTLELNKIYTALRYDSIITGYDNSNLQLYKNEIETRVKNLPGKLIVESYPTKTASTYTIKSHLDRCIALGNSPDIIIVDYADLLKGHNKELRFELKQIYEGLRTIASEYNCPVWTASQSNRTSLDAEVITADMIAEDYSKIAIGDFILSLSRRSEDKLAGTGRYHVIKNRFGLDGVTFYCAFDASNGNIEVYRENSKDAVRIKQDLTRESIKITENHRRIFNEEFGEI